MPREFATKKNHHTNRMKAESQVPGWVWLFTGAVLGAFVMFLIHLSDVESNDDKPQKTVLEKIEETSEKMIPITFYEKLKESTEFEFPQLNSKEKLEKAKLEPSSFLVQVASFKSAKDAEQLRVELIMLGLTEAHTRAAQIADNDTRHRVLVGPLSTKTQLEFTRKTLLDNKLEALVLKQK